MSVEVYPSEQVVFDPLRHRRVAVAGYGNQGHAHALNLRDSGASVVVGQRAGAGAERARHDGFDVASVSEATRQADLVILTLPDETSSSIYKDQVAPALRDGACLGFAHGFNIRFGYIAPPPGVDVIMVAPKGPGTLLRSLFLEGKGLPVLLAVHQNASGHAEALALAWAAGLGANRAAVVKTTFAMETETDLFGEQAVLCGGVTALVQSAFDTLTAAGYPPEFAYLECVHELKQIVDLIYSGGVESMRRRISNTAEYGDRSRGPRVISAAVRAAMEQVLEEIREGRFAEEWIRTYAAKGERFRDGGSTEQLASLERAGEVVRRWMPWLSK